VCNMHSATEPPQSWPWSMMYWWWLEWKPWSAISWVGSGFHVPYGCADRHRLFGAWYHRRIRPYPREQRYLSSLNLHRSCQSFHSTDPGAFHQHPVDRHAVFVGYGVVWWVTIRHFVTILLIGVFSGTYSSIFNASPILVVWENHEWRHWFHRLNGKKWSPNRRCLLINKLPEFL